eukprot:2381019-Rhodomonas_salina.1
MPGQLSCSCECCDSIRGFVDMCEAVAGVVEHLSSEFSPSTEKEFRLLELIDTPGQPRTCSRCLSLFFAFFHCFLWAAMLFAWPADADPHLRNSLRRRSL